MQEYNKDPRDPTSLVPPFQLPSDTDAERYLATISKCFEHIAAQIEENERKCGIKKSDGLAKGTKASTTNDADVKTESATAARTEGSGEVIVPVESLTPTVTALAAAKTTADPTAHVSEPTSPSSPSKEEEEAAMIAWTKELEDRKLQKQEGKEEKSGSREQDEKGRKDGKSAEDGEVHLSDQFKYW